jgi:predicted TIM-barrel fold metal-dependent hydrolase
VTPLFDANAHPATSSPGKAETFSIFVKKLADANFLGACAVGLPCKEGFEHRVFLKACRASKNLFPVAAWPNTPLEKIEGQLAALSAMGYRAVKIHPRFSGLSVRDPRFAQTLRMAAAADLIVFHCSYQFAADNSLHPVDPLPWLLEAVGEAPTLRMVLLHGGTVELLRYAASVRVHPNVLLDLSWTLQKYEGSSLDQDISYLFRTFDRRMCIGTDYPDYEPAHLRARFEALADGLPPDKRENIGWKNIVEFLKIEGSSAPPLDQPSLPT